MSEEAQHLTTANIFLEQPEFILADPRRNRPDGKGLGYKVTPEFMLVRHQALLPKELVEGKRILDLGSCTAASGAWCLSQGAAFYTGIELNEEFAEESVSCLAKYYDQALWRIDKTSIEDFVSATKDRFDLVLASGVIYGLADPIRFIEHLAKLTDFVVVESVHRHLYFGQLSDQARSAVFDDPKIVDSLENSSFISVGPQRMIGADNETLAYFGLNPSMGALKILFGSHGFSWSDLGNRALKRDWPQVYNPRNRFALHFLRHEKAKRYALGFANALRDPENVLKKMNWSDQ